MRPSKRSVQIVTAIGILAWLTAAGAGILLTRSQAGTWAEMLVYSTIVPVLLAAFIFGRSGGLLTALLASLVAGSLAIGRPETLQSPIVQRVLLQVIFFNVVALVISGLSEREKKAAQSYREMFDGVPTGLYRTTPKGQILDANPALAQMLGYPDQESLLAVNVSSMYVSPDARERKLALLESKGVIHGFEMQLYRYDGSVIWVRDSARAVCDADGEQRYYEGSLEDITAQIQAQEALRESETLLKTIFDGISDPMHVVDSGYRVVATNKKLLDLRGLVQEEIVGKPCYEVYQNRDTHCVECAAREAFATGRAAQVDKSLPMEDGSRRRFEVYAFPILTGDGNVDRVIELTRDVTERKQAEAEIARLATVVEQAAVTVVITDLEGDIVYANPDFETSTGYSVAEALGQNPRVLKSDRQDAPFYQELWDTITAGRTWRGVFINKRKDGELYHEDATIFPIKNTDGEIINYAAVKRNITERVRAQVQIAGLNRLRESLLRPDRLEKKLERITAGVVEIFQADFCRIWLTRPGDRCDDGCFHASVTEGPHVCRQRERCMHLVASSGRYTHIDGEVHRRVPFDCYKIGRVASGAESQFLTNDVTRDPRIHDPDWAGELGLVSFAGYRLLSDDGDPIGVLALFSQRAISPDEDGLLEGVANTAAQMIQTDKAEQALAEKTLYLDNILRSATEYAIATTDLEFRVTYYNPLAERFLGYTAREVIGRTVQEMHTRENVAPERFERAVENIRAHGEYRYMVVQELDEGTRYLDSRASGIYDPDDELVGFALFSHDVTERKRAEVALRESEAKYRTLFTNIADPIFIFDQETNHFLDCNQSVIDRYGYTLEELRDMTPSRLHPPEELGEVERNIANEESVLPHVYTHITKQGERLRVEVHTAFLEYEGQNAWISIVRDITERVRAEQALRESEERFRLTFRTSPDSININRLQDGLYVDINEGFTDVMGYAREDVIGKTSLELNIWGNPQDRARMAAGLKKDGYCDNLEAEFVAKDGSIKIGLMSAKIIELHNEPHILSITRDITERKQVQEERERLLAQINEQSKRIQQTIDTVPEGVLLLDAHGQVVIANPVAEKDLHVLIGRDVLLTHEPITHLGDRPLTELLTSPPTKGLWHEVRIGARTFEIIARPIENGPEPENWVLVINDVTRERDIRTRLHQQERLAVVGQLAAGIAHDFNNILASIVLYAQMVARSQALSDRDQERLTVITQQAWHATRLITQILDFSRRAVLERQPLDLLLLLKEQVKLLERTLPENIRINLAYGPDDYMLNADPTRIQQMLTNLAVNARDAMPDGGTLRIGLERITAESGQSSLLPEMEAGEWIRLTISDSGTGIAPEVLPHIYEPFFTTKGPGEGSGLGLAQVYGIVKQHKGHIDVTTEVGAGTTFTLYLPALRTERPELPAIKVENIPRGHGEIILVVEDDAALRQALVDILTLLNYQVLAAVNGRKALDILVRRADEIALVLSDLVMPEMGGQALFHAMRRRNLILPVVMLSGHPMTNDLESLQKQGLAGWMLKPPDVEEIARLVAHALRGAVD